MSSYVSAPQQHFLKSVGSADDPMHPNWVEVAPQELEIIHFARNPASVRVDDYLVYYAAVHQKLIGIVKVFTKPEFDAQLEHWQYFSRVRPQLIIKDMDRAPSIDVMNVDTVRDFRKTVMQLDYTILADDEWQRALAALEAACDESKGDIRDSRFKPQA